MIHEKNNKNVYPKCCLTGLLDFQIPFGRSISLLSFEGKIGAVLQVSPMGSGFGWPVAMDSQEYLLSRLGWV